MKWLRFCTRLPGLSFRSTATFSVNECDPILYWHIKSRRALAYCVLLVRYVLYGLVHALAESTNTTVRSYIQNDWRFQVPIVSCGTPAIWVGNELKSSGYWHPYLERVGEGAQYKQKWLLREGASKAWPTHFYSHFDPWRLARARVVHYLMHYL